MTARRGRPTAEPTQHSGNNVQAGLRLRWLREDAKMSLQAVEDATARRFGVDNRVRYQQIARIERGQMEKPPIIDLIRLGSIFGLSAEDIGEMYNLWPRVSRDDDIDPRLRRAIQTARSIRNDQAREKMLSWIEFAVMQTIAEEREASDQESASVG